MENKENIICYDIAMTPDEVPLEKIIEIAKEFNYLFYDSYKHESQFPIQVPYVLNGNKMTKYLVDVSTVEGKNKLKEVLDGK